LADAVGSIGPGPEVIYATGNHDVRAEFHRQLLGRNDTEPILQVRLVSGLRVIVLDSTISGAGHGRLATAHLDELRQELATPAPDGTIVVLHHAPVPPPSPLLSYFALEGRSRRALAQAVAGTDVRLILAGHHHIAQSAMLGSVPVAVAGSTTIRTDPLAPTGHERTSASRTFNLVQVYPDTIAISVLPVDGAAVVFDLDPADCRAIIDAHPVEQGG
jgi:3',5'-cyclic AMP phosphodiesterase CpdA